MSWCGLKGCWGGEKKREREREKKIERERELGNENIDEVKNFRNYFI